MLEPVDKATVCCLRLQSNQTLNKVKILIGEEKKSNHSIANKFVTMNNSSNETSSGNILLKNCRDNWPHEICAFANVCGLISTAIWFLVLLPQVLRNFRYKSVEGLSLGWAIINFTAAFNNTFFVFFFWDLPLYTKISAVYMPILEAVLLLQFVLFTSASKKKWIIAGVCGFIWIGIIAVQSTAQVYSIMEWVSITLWSIATFPQVFLNLRRQSTYGLALEMVALTTVGKTTDFASTYLLIMPMQYVVMAYFSSSTAFINALQVIWYWNQIPVDTYTPEKNETSSSDDSKFEKIEGGHFIRLPTGPSCFVLRWILMPVFSLEMVAFAVAIVWRTEHWASILAPVATIAAIAGAYCWYRMQCCQSFRDKLPDWVKDIGF